MTAIVSSSSKRPNIDKWPKYNPVKNQPAVRPGGGKSNVQPRSPPWHTSVIPDMEDGSTTDQYLSGSNGKSIWTIFCVPGTLLPTLLTRCPLELLSQYGQRTELPSHGSRRGEQSLQAVTLQVMIIRLSPSEKSRATRSFTLHLPVTTYIFNLALQSFSTFPQDWKTAVIVHRPSVEKSFL